MIGRLFQRNRSKTYDGEVTTLSKSSSSDLSRSRAISLNREPPLLPGSPSPIKRLRKNATKDEGPSLPPASPLASLTLSDNEFTKKHVALFFDFDCTLSARHLYGTIRVGRDA